MGLLRQCLALVALFLLSLANDSIRLKLESDPLGTRMHYLPLYVGSPPVLMKPLIDTGSGLASFPCSC